MFDIKNIASPEFLKDLSVLEMEALSQDIRKFLIEEVSKTGGHLSSNLGIVELTIALHHVFDSPRDKLIFDVGHQGYVHKILTGRAKDFGSLRKTNGLSGFLKYTESKHDVWEAGHSSTSLSAAVGFAEARKENKDIGEIIPIIGDGSLQNGLAFSALNLIGNDPKNKVIIILNDNDMSISKPVGSLSRMFNRVRIKRSYHFLKKITPTFVHKLTRNLKNSVRSYIYGPNIFHSFGLKYFGAIDGHNIKELIRYLHYAKEADSSCIIHIKTQKGKGYPHAEKDHLGLWHGVAPFDITSGGSVYAPTNGSVSWSDAIGDLLCTFSKQDKFVRIITPAMISGSGLLKCYAENPSQLLDVGIAEDHAVTMAAAMALQGMRPIVSIYSTFLQRAYDQINHDVCRQDAHVVFVLDRSGIVGADGDTHQGVFDIAYLSHLPNLVISMAKDAYEARALLEYGLYHQEHPFVLRYPKGSVARITEEQTEFILQPTWEIIQEISSVTILTYGPIITQLQERLEQDQLRVGLINARFIKPLDLDVLKQCRGTKVIIVEEVSKIGGLNAMICQAILDQDLDIDVITIALPDVYIEHGSIEDLQKEYQIDLDSIIEQVRKCR